MIGNWKERRTRDPIILVRVVIIPSRPVKDTAGLIKERKEFARLTGLDISLTRKPYPWQLIVRQILERNKKDPDDNSLPGLRNESKKYYRRAMKRSRSFNRTASYKESLCELSFLGFAVFVRRRKLVPSRGWGCRARGKRIGRGLIQITA